MMDRHLCVENRLLRFNKIAFQSANPFSSQNKKFVEANHCQWARGHSLHHKNPITLYKNKIGCRRTPTARAFSGQNKAILSFDIGTSSTKAALFHCDDKNRLGPIYRTEHVTKSDQTGNVTQEPAEWLKAAIEVGRKVLSADSQITVIAIAVTGQMQDLIPVGPSPPNLLSRSCLLYSDSRAQKQAAELSDALGKQIPATSLLSKLRLLEIPSNSSDYSILLGAADYIVYSLCEEPKPLLTDATTASTTGLTLEPSHRCYNSSLLHSAGLESFEPMLPEIMETISVAGVLSSSVANALGQEYLQGIPVIHAGGDAFSATIGAGEQPYVYGGTSGWTGACVSSNTPPSGDGVFRLAHSSITNTSIEAGSVAAVGGALRMANNSICCYSDVTALTTTAKRSTIGAGGVAWIPYAGGRRCPRPIDISYTALCGLNTCTTRDDIARAVVEGVVFAITEAANEIKHSLENDIRVVGGVTKSEVFVQGVAALISKNGRVIVGNGEVGVWGAGKIAAKVLGLDSGADWVGAIPGDSNIVEVPKDERDKWFEAWHRWQKGVRANEETWKDWSTV